MRAAFLFCLLLAGCFGGSQNPSYFPYYLGTEDVIRTHAKPGGLGYFKNFDPKACRIEVTPANVNSPTRAQVVLIATVFDKDNDARRKRRVEWQIEGPGSIVEVDESGILPGRGYQVTDKFAVSYTDVFSHTITRGNDNPRDDFTVEAGQSWCVVSSPVAGETVVTAYAPEVYDWDKRRAFAKVVWTDGGFVPQPVRSGRETDSTLLERAKADAPPAAAAPSLRLDANLAKSVAVNREVTATVTLLNTGKTNSAAATVRVVLPAGVDLARTDPGVSRRSGSDLYWNLDAIGGGASKEITLVLRPTKAGAFSLVAAADTQDGLTASTKADSVADTAGMTVSVQPPKFSAAGDKTEIGITVSNPGNVPIENAIAWVTPGAGLRATTDTSPMEVKVGSVPPGQSRSVTASLNADQSGSVRVDVAADGGLAAHGEATVTVGKVELTVRVVGPESVPVGETATYEVQVINASDLSASNVVVDVILPKGMTAKTVTDGDATSDGAAWKLATLAPGEKRVLRFTAAGNNPSELGSITATVNGTLASGGKIPATKATAPAAVRGQPVLVMDLQAPSGPVSAGSRPSYRIVVSNRGTGPASNVTATADFSGELRAARGTPNGTISGSGVSFSRLGDIAAGASVTLTVEADAIAAGDARISVAVQSKDLPSPLKEEQATRITAK